MMRAMPHLGPDRTNSWHHGACALGSLMMRITHEDALDVQPLHHDSASFVCDARLDNREELAEALGIAAGDLARMPDSELLFRAWQHWGEHCPDHLIGDFTFAAWDAESRNLVLGRDHMGQRHVMFHRGEGFFAFATERKALWALPQVPRVLTDGMIAKVLALGTRVSPDMETGDVIDGLRGGCVLRLDADGEMTIRRYWEPRADPAHEGHDEAYYIAAYRRVLGEAVACRLRRSPHKAGLFMGGGFDSSAICGLSGAVVTQQGRKFVAASSVMPADYKGTIRHGRKWLEMCARHMPHLEPLYVTREGMDIFSTMESGFASGDGPHSGAHYVNVALYRAIAASGAKIVMDGHGGDYTLNPRAQSYLYEQLRAGNLRRFWREWRARKRWMGLSLYRMITTCILPYLAPEFMQRRQRRMSGLDETGPTLPISQKAKQWFGDTGATRRFEIKRGYRGNLLTALRRIQDGPTIGGSIPAAAHRMEFTQPYHDKRVVELGLAVPEHLYMKNGRERWLARRAFADLYPPEYQDRTSANDDPAPDFLAMAKRIEPQILAEIDRMEAAGKLNEWFDFPKMRKMLTRRRLDEHASGNEYDTHQAVLTFIRARYIEWFRGDNN